jgi:predicted RNA-binding protein with PIN domain
MHLIIDGYNLLHVFRSPVQLNPVQLRWERERLMDRLSTYRQTKPCEITVVFDGWQGDWTTEKREKKKGVELIYSRRGERADEVIKRLAKEKGSGAVIITSDREISRYAEKMAVAVIPSDQFHEKMEQSQIQFEKDFGADGEERGLKRKGPSRRLSKKEKRLRLALKKI